MLIAQPSKACSPMLVTGKFITLQKSLCYLNSNGNQVTIQKRAELHILSRYTHFQRTLLSECKDNHLFCYHQRNGQKLNVFIGFCYLFLGYYMSFSYQVHFGNDFLFLTIGSLSAHFPTADCFVIGLSFYCRNILLGKPKRMLWQWSDEKTAR